MISPQIFGCSVFTIPVYNNGAINNTVGSRTMDFEVVLPAPMIKGLKGDNNVSQLNVGDIPKERALNWVNKHNYIGKMLSLKGEVTDGINDAGLYVGALYLPGKTAYSFEPTTNKKILAVYDIANYLLGTSDSVASSIKQLESIEVIGNALNIDGTYVAPPLHFYIADKDGNAAVVEFTDKGMRVHTKNPLNEPNNVMTNAPDYEWQLNNYQDVTKQFVARNQPINFDGVYANGSGYIGLPGDFMPQSRFVRLKVLLNALPKPKNSAEAEYINRRALSSAIVPLNLNPAPTLWYSTFDLRKGDYIVVHLIQLDYDKKYIVAKDSKEHRYNIFRDLDSIKLKAQLTYPTERASIKDVQQPSPPEPDTPYDAGF